MRIIFATALLFLIATPDVEAGQRIPISAAMAQCKVLDGPTTLAQEQYRACVVAKSGRRPPEEKPEPGVRITGSARIGIVVSK
ncbi:MAG: hypothetical protein AAF393_17050 [Pseudomonadota bacterium]